MARKAVTRVNPWFIALARWGYVAKGGVYLTVGGLALAVLLGDGGELTDVPGALWAIARRPLGRAALFLIALGLFGHAALRLVQSLLDPERRGRTWRMAVVRIGELSTGIGHTLLGIAASKIVLGTGGPAPGDAKTRSMARHLLSHSWGDWLVVLLGVVVFVIGVSFIIRAFAVRDICAGLRLEALPRYGCRSVAGVIRYGLLAQGGLFGVVGQFMIRAGLDREPREASGPAGVLRIGTTQPYGRLLLAFFAAGLLCVALSCFAEALWRHVPPVAPDPREPV